ncbi:MAG: deacylase [Geobacteraceae bacterium GWC2_58_44]|nr:MAG: deacylase [Geobacteraceae bacterium GWC2_58_44]
MRNLPSLLLFIVIAVSCYPSHCLAAHPFWSSTGIRGGLSADGKDSHLRQLELFAVYQLPWELRDRSGWGVATQLQVTAGAMNSNGEYGFIGSAGPALSFGKTGFPLDLDLGFSFAVLSRDTFGDRDYNGYGQFISHAGVDYRLSPALGLGYRYQHMSNAGINGDRNPGVNMHLVGLSWHFAE